MERFLALYRALDQTQRTVEKLSHLQAYFRMADPHEAAWVVQLLRGGHARRFLSPRKLKSWLADYLNLPLALVEECHHQVGDLAETVALLLPNRHRPPGGLPPLPHLAEVELPALLKATESAQRQWLEQWWEKLAFWETFLLHKLLLGALRVGVAEGLVQRALAEALNLTEARIAQKLQGTWQPSPTFYDYLRQPTHLTAEPYPFFLAYPIEELGPNFVEKLGPTLDYQVEWKWDGVRVQIVRRQSEVAVFSRNGVRIDPGFPELVERFRCLPPDTVVDGELLIVKEGQVQPFGALQRRLMRKKVTPALLRELPATVWLYDLLELRGTDLRGLSLIERRRHLEELAALLPVLELSPVLRVADWSELHRLSAFTPPGAEGFMIKRLDSPYLIGRRRGYWWKWKREPFRLDAVLVYAQQGHGRRAGWYTDLTFALWNDRGELVTFTKAYSGLTDEEMQTLSRWVRKNTLEKIGPIAKVPPLWVFEIGFEGIQRSNRHKCGFAVRFPRILRWRKDKSPAEANSLADLAQLYRTIYSVQDMP
ncbi:MAG: ATP-dependent DNA ligase [Bacteroidia bacterium]|nr:ATP-dependent DNA ligase [Bacteroidia bacterium]MDW8089578.1 ATP-dependent DNA ligase [Bacteroidia bacterium]